MIIKDLPYIKDINTASKVRGSSLGNFSFNSALLGKTQLPDSSLSSFSLVNNPDNPMLWRLPDLTSGRVMPTW